MILVLEYLRCKTLCGLALENLVAALDALPLDAGRDFQMLAISIDPRDSRPSCRGQGEISRDISPAGGAGRLAFPDRAPAVVERIAGAVGFPYRYDAAIDQYIHPAGFILAAADGRISRYIFGVEATAAELRAASPGGPGEALGPLTRLFLRCHGEEPPLGRYTVPIEAAFAVANVAAMAALFVVFAAIRRRRHG